jgi:hypothetical protein
VELLSCLAFNGNLRPYAMASFQLCARELQPERLQAVLESMRRRLDAAEMASQPRCNIENPQVWPSLFAHSVPVPRAAWRASPGATSITCKCGPAPCGPFPLNRTFCSLYQSTNVPVHTRSIFLPGLATRPLFSSVG